MTSRQQHLDPSIAGERSNTAAEQYNNAFIPQRQFPHLPVVPQHPPTPPPVAIPSILKTELSSIARRFASIHCSIDNRQAKIAEMTVQEMEGTMPNWMRVKTKIIEAIDDVEIAKTYRSKLFNDERKKEEDLLAESKALYTTLNEFVSVVSKHFIGLSTFNFDDAALLSFTTEEIDLNIATFRLKTSKDIALKAAKAAKFQARVAVDATVAVITAKDHQKLLSTIKTMQAKMSKLTLTKPKSKPTPKNVKGAALPKKVVPKLAASRKDPGTKVGRNSRV